VRKLIVMRPNPLPESRLAAVLIPCLSILSLGACGDDPFQIRWAADVDTVSLFSLARPELNLGSAYNFDQRRILVVEAPGSSGSWDLAVDDDGTEMYFVLPEVLGIESRAALAPVPGVSFEDLTEAPSDTAAYIGNEIIPIQIGTVYAVRTSEGTGFFGETCVYYGKLQPIEKDLVRGTVSFFFDASPVCNDRSLIPTEENDAN